MSVFDQAVENGRRLLDVVEPGAGSSFDPIEIEKTIAGALVALRLLAFVEGASFERAIEKAEETVVDTNAVAPIVAPAVRLEGPSAEIFKACGVDPDSITDDELRKIRDAAELTAARTLATIGMRLFQSREARPMVR